MATITLSIASTPVTASKSYTLSDADVTRLVTALKPFYNQPSASNAVIMGVWADDVMGDLKRTVKDYEARTNPPADISIT